MEPIVGCRGPIAIRADGASLIGMLNSRRKRVNPDPTVRATHL